MLRALDPPRSPLSASDRGSEAPIPTRTPGLFLREPRHIYAALRAVVLAGVTLLGVATPPQLPFLYWFVVCIYGVTIFGYLWARNRDFELRRVKWLMFLFDLGLVGGLVFLHGHNVEGFAAAYLGIVLMSAIVEGAGHALLNASFVSVTYIVLTRWGEPLRKVVDFETASHFVFFFVVAIFMGFLAEEARKQGRERKRTSRQLGATSAKLKKSLQELGLAREAMRADDRLRTLGMLSAGIAHEMRSPLAAIVNSLDPVPDVLDEIEADVAAGGRGTEPAGELREIVADCHLACGQLQRVISDLTGVARNGGGPPSRVSPRDAVESALRILRRRLDGVEVVVQIETEADLLADQGRLLQVLINLAGNALDAMDGKPGAMLTIRVEDAPDGYVALLVVDTGPGMPDEVRSRVFEPFFSTKGSAGTGLGLHLVAEIVAAHQGHIECESAPGWGTRFRVLLPTFDETETQELECEDGPQDRETPDRGRRGDDSSGDQEEPAAGAVRTSACV